MDDLKFGLGFTCLILFSSWTIGGYAALLPSIVLCFIPLIYEIKEKLRFPSMNLGTCVVCGQKYRINDKMTSGERKICHLCINKIFKYEKSVPEMDTSASE